MSSRCSRTSRSRERRRRLNGGRPWTGAGGGERSLGFASRPPGGAVRNDGLARGRAVSGSWHGVADLVTARRENVVLRERTRRLEQELDRLAEVDLENARLRDLLEFRRTLGGDAVTGRVIGRDATGLARTLTI